VGFVKVHIAQGRCCECTLLIPLNRRCVFTVLAEAVNVKKAGVHAAISLLWPLGCLYISVSYLCSRYNLCKP